MICLLSVLAPRAWADWDDHKGEYKCWRIDNVGTKKVVKWFDCPFNPPKYEYNESGDLVVVTSPSPTANGTAASAPAISDSDLIKLTLLGVSSADITAIKAGQFTQISPAGITLLTAAGVPLAPPGGGGGNATTTTTTTTLRPPTQNKKEDKWLSNNEKRLENYQKFKSRQRERKEKWCDNNSGKIFRCDWKPKDSVDHVPLFQKEKF